MSSSPNGHPEHAAAARSAVLTIVAITALADCRCRTTYDSATTKTCMDEAMAASDKVRIEDGGYVDPNPMCRDCCHRHRLDDVEPGYCSCGELGVDALLK